MAKMKGWAVEVQIVQTRTVYVEARREQGAIDKIMTREGWAEATRYQEDGVLDAVMDPTRDGVTVVGTRTT